MELIDPILEFDLQIGRERLQVNIDANPHTIANVWGDETHNHPRFEVHIMLNGSCRIDVDGTNHLLRQGQMIVIAPGQYHRLESGNWDFERLSVTIGPAAGALRRAMQEVVGKRNCYPVTEEMVNLCRGILAEGEKNRRYRKEMMQVQVSELAISVLRELDLGEENRGMDKEERRMPSAIDMYFERNLAQNPSAEDLAQQLYLSRRHLNRILQANYGMGFREKLLQARLERAKWLLRRTEKSVSVIAGEVGYTYDSAFREAFCRQVGVTPQAYRLQHKQTGVQEKAGK